MAVERRKCATCGDGFLGTPRAQYCKDACRQKAARRRRPKPRADRNADRNVTVGAAPSAAVHTPQALAVLSALAAEASENAVDRGEPAWEDGEDDWTAAERVVLDMIAAAVDRRVDLEARYAQADEDKLRIKLSGELRLIQGHIAQLLKQVKTDVPPAPSRKSQKASQAATARWRRDGSGTA